MSEQKVQAKGDEFTDTMGEVYPFYNQPPWKIKDDWGQMNLGQRLRYGFSHGLEQFGGWPGALLGQGMRLPFAHMFRKMFGKGGNTSGGMNVVGPDGQRYPVGGFSGPPAGATEEEQANWYKQNWPTDTYRAGGPPGVHPGWGTGFGVLRGDPTRPMTPGMAGFLGQHAGGMTNPFGYSTGGWEDAVIGARGNRRGSFDNPVAGMSLEQVQKLMEWRKANKHLQPKYEGPAWEGQEYEGQRPPWLEHYWGGGSSTSKAIQKY